MFLCGDLKPKQHLSCLGDCHAVTSAISQQQRQQHHLQSQITGMVSAQSPTTACTCLSDVRLLLRQHTPITTAVKGLLLQRSATSRVRGHLWPLVSTTTTAWQSPRHPPTGTNLLPPPTPSKHRRSQRNSFCPQTPGHQTESQIFTTVQAQQ